MLKPKFKVGDRVSSTFYNNGRITDIIVHKGKCFYTVMWYKKIGGAYCEDEIRLEDYYSEFIERIMDRMSNGT